jgi:hypothetical protein
MDAVTPDKCEKGTQKSAARRARVPLKHGEKFNAFQ